MKIDISTKNLLREVGTMIAMLELIQIRIFPLFCTWPYKLKAIVYKYGSVVNIAINSKVLIDVAQCKTSKNLI